MMQYFHARTQDIKQQGNRMKLKAAAKQRKNKQKRKIKMYIDTAVLKEVNHFH